MRKHLNKSEIEKLQESVKEYAQVLDLIDVHTVITDPHANIIYANKAAESNTGYSKEELLGKNPGDLWGGNMPKEFFEKMWKTIKSDKKKFVGEIKNIRKDGHESWQEIHISPILDNKGQIDYFLASEIPVQDKKETIHKLDLIWKSFIEREDEIAKLKTTQK